MANDSTLRCGAAALDITPPLGTHLSGSGMGEHRPAKSILDPLYAKAIVLEEPGSGRRLALVALDLILITREYCDKVRQGAAERFGLDPDAVMVHCTQTHSAPSFGHCMLDDDFPLDIPAEQEYVRGAETPYCRWGADRAVEAIGRAIERLRPVEIGFGRTERHDLAYNRREEKTIDPEVGVVGLRGLDGRMVALLLHYSCHPVNVFCKGWKDREAWHAVSADWCGAWAQQMQRACGEGCVPIVINGSCGNINPGAYEPMWDCDHRRQGAELARTSREVLANLVYERGFGSLDSRVRVLPLDYRDVPPERLAQVDRILATSPQPAWTGPGKIDNDWFLAASTRSIEHSRRRSEKFSYEIQAFRIGDLAIVGLPGEPFSEGQLDLKRRSPARQTMVAHMVSQYVGYLPAQAVYDTPGHETNTVCTYWAKLAKGSLEKIVDTSVAVLGEMFGEQAQRPDGT